MTGQRPAGERGSATVWMLAVSGVLAVVGAAAVLTGAAVVARHRATAAADLAALAAAGRAVAGDAGPCVAAERIAAANGAEVTSCTVDAGAVVEVAGLIRVELGGLGVHSATGRARAGPVAPRISASGGGRTGGEMLVHGEPPAVPVPPEHDRLPLVQERPPAMRGDGGAHLVRQHGEAAVLLHASAGRRAAHDLEAVVLDPPCPLLPVVLEGTEQPVGGVEQKGGVLAEAGEVGLQVTPAEGSDQGGRRLPDLGGRRSRAVPGQCTGSLSAASSLRRPAR
jgi:secretion/DNA translocation related TadE-like protein